MPGVLSSVRSLLVGGPRIQKISDLQRTTAIEIATGWDGGFREAFVERNHFSIIFNLARLNSGYTRAEHALTHSIYLACSPE